MLNITHQTEEAAQYVQSLWPKRPAAGIILGSGLGDLANDIEQAELIDYASIPHFPRSTALGHEGRLVCGYLAGMPVITMQGRFHFYEGYSLHELTMPVRVMNTLGIGLLIVSNAAGGINPNFSAGDVMIIQDHINLIGGPATASPGDDGQADDRIATYSCCREATYDSGAIDVAQQVARRANFVAQLGVYAAQRGPNYETRAEYRYLRRIGVDAVGMSTAPEALVAAGEGVRVLGLSAITNICLPDALDETTGEGVIETAAQAAEKMRRIVFGILDSLSTA
ncbi:MAG: purine-nucleoside phosphorylase [Pirellulales bacterium]|nr:purine-nucleoside phosphorylase [Pirellulales bacterium]